MRIEEFAASLGVDFFAGVPDSQLKALCNFLMDRYGLDPAHHIIAANEGNAAALAAGYHLATGKVPAVYLQNSGLGNVVNPAASLLNEKVYGIPCLFLVGWRGEPGVHDEPQHIFQGEITLPLLDTMGIPYDVIDRTTTIEQVDAKLERYRALFTEGKQAAFVVRRGALEYSGQPVYRNAHPMRREEAIGCILSASGEDPVVSTTGKASREVFELREARAQGHSRDFLTVGSMGHSSSIALGIALQKPDRRVWCLDGDGAALMHLGAMALIGANRPANLIHIVLNNEAHESVGGMPTVAGRVDLCGVARACGYPRVFCADSRAGLSEALDAAKASRQLTFLEVRCALGARENLGRPTTTPQENKEAFMAALKDSEL